MNCFNISGVAVKAFSRFKFVPVFLLVLSSLVFMSAAPAAELLVNGDFESPDLGDKTLFAPTSKPLKLGWTTFYGQNFTGTCSTDPLLGKACNDDMLIDGWSVVWTDTLLDPVPTPGRVEIQNNLLAQKSFLVSAAKQGGQKAELDSHHRWFPGGGVNDNTNVSLYQEFQVCALARYQMTYWWKSRTTIPGDNDVRVVVGDAVVRIHTLTDSWQMETINFIGDVSGATGIAFVSIGDGETHGMSLDAVSVTGPNPLIEDCPPPPGECEDCSEVPVGWVDSLTCEPCIDNTNSGSTSGSTSGSGSGSTSGSGSGSTSGSTSGSGSGGTNNGCGLCDNPGKPVSLELLYDGDDFTSHAQNKSFSILPAAVGAGGFPSTANIEVRNKKVDGVVLFAGSVKIGETFTFQRVNAPYIRIFDPVDNSVVQTVEFHTSCSQPLELLDTFGGITLWEATY